MSFQGKGGGLGLPLFKVCWSVSTDCCLKQVLFSNPSFLSFRSLCLFMPSVVKHTRKLIMYLQKERYGVDFNQFPSLILFMNFCAGTSHSTCS